MTADTLATRAAFSAIAPELRHLYRQLWATPELAMMEHESAATLAIFLERHGFAVERAAGGLPTAFKAVRGRGGPVIGILAEYDALPGLANQAQPHRAPLRQPAGHACGHNHIGPNACAAGIAAADALGRLDLAGTIIVYGCPAEEILWGKVAMMQQGVFAGAEILFANHADYQSGSLSRRCQAVVIGEFVFAGNARHSGLGTTPNALDGLELFVQTYERLRGTRFADCKIAHVIRQGGMTPGVVPAEARLSLAIKHETSFERALAIWQALQEIAAACAAQARVRVTPVYLAGSRGYLPNDVAALVLRDQLAAIGAPAYAPEALAWMEKLAHAAGDGSSFALPPALGYYDEGCDPYGQDDGELSWRIPLARVNWALPLEVPLHNWAMTALCGYAGYDPGPMMAAEATALAAVEFCRQPHLVREAKAELARRTGGIEPQTPPVGLFEVMTRTPELYWDATYRMPQAAPALATGDHRAS